MSLKGEEKFELKGEPATAQPSLPVPATEGIRSSRPERRRRDSARLVWDSKPKRPPSPRDIEFQTAEVVIPNPGRDSDSLPFTFREAKRMAAGKLYVLDANVYITAANTYYHFDLVGSFWTTLVDLAKQGAQASSSFW